MSSETNRVIVHGVPGEGARFTGVIKGFIPLLASVFLFGIFAGVILPVEAGGLAFTGLIVVFAVMLWLAYNSYSRGAESYFKGARGEEIVAIWLASLPAGYHVFHDVDLSKVGSLDHLVAGPTGVFVIETKFWAGAVTSDGTSLLVDGLMPSRSPVQQVLKEAAALQEFLKEKMSDAPTVTPVVCFASNTLAHDQRDSCLKVGDVAVCNVGELCDLITSGGQVFSAVDIERFVKLWEY
ncbi:MAG: nuclease-related domain-containing protein [Kiritimatiellae bacterium]|nr:nuclease-related domain-containing protein [Kiritimatiellia bacterium]